MNTWKIIPDYGEHYQINREGVIRINPSSPRLKLQESRKGKKGYASLKKAGDRVSIYVGQGYKRANLKDECGRNSSVMVHRVLMLTFQPPVDDSLQINHKDGDKLNNNIENLEWCTHLENLKHAWDTGLRPAPSHRILDEEQVLEVREMRASSDKTLEEIGKLYGVTQCAIWRIVHRKTWKHI